MNNAAVLAKRLKRSIKHRKLNCWLWVEEVISEIEIIELTSDGKAVSAGGCDYQTMNEYNHSKLET